MASIQEITLRVHEALHECLGEVQIGEHLYRVGTHSEFGVPEVFYASKSGKITRWVVQDNVSRFRDDKILAQLARAGHRITRILTQEPGQTAFRTQPYGVMDGRIYGDLPAAAIQQVRRVLNPS